MSGTAIAAIRLLCPDPEATAQFYGHAFGCTAEASGSLVGLQLGEQRIELTRTAAGSTHPAVANATSFQHFAIVVTDIEAAMRQLEGVPGWTPISRGGPVQLPASSGGVRAFKFRDPDGHPLEFLASPPDATPPAWRLPGLILGIDHTAITVADVGRSIAFYDSLGFTVSSRGVNRGDTQTRLDGLDDPVVDVIALTPPGAATPHLELLGYRAPAVVAAALAGGDVLATRTVLTGADGQVGEIADPDGHRLVFR